ncbi:hypothetical protein N7456_003280 [Penicillium angulare]|uniref:Rhodopsin domain-containing protein n=1 Tax=Penicillium angulare TaxID=116970 RepID=A0A9W9KHE9_9EURO|nr:hypothetical protein N7456_003280 [Penicillium angulare]
MIGAKYGIGKPANAIKESDTVPMLQCIYATRVLYTVAMGLIKMSLLWFYLRLDPRKYMRWAVFFVMFINFGLSFSSSVVTLAGCHPVHLFWSNPTSSNCMSESSQQNFYEVNGVLNIVTDILTCLLPIPMIYGLQLNWRKKAAILGIFGLGILSVAAACVRYNFVTKLTSATSNYYLVLADSLNWCAIEAYVAIFCGCAPSLSVLFKTYLPSIFGPKSAKYDSNTSKSPGTSNLQRINPRKGHRRRGLGDTTLGSQDAIVTTSNTDPDHDGIMMKTDIVMDVAKRNSTEDMTYQRKYYEFSRRP